MVVDNLLISITNKCTHIQDYYADDIAMLVVEVHINIGRSIQESRSQRSECMVHYKEGLLVNPSTTTFLLLTKRRHLEAVCQINITVSS